jgi:hypothetical protein
MLRVEFNAEEIAAKVMRRYQRRAGTAERIENQIAGLAEALMIGARLSTGFCVGCSRLPVYFQSRTSGIGSDGGVTLPFARR